MKPGGLSYEQPLRLACGEPPPLTQGRLELGGPSCGELPVKLRSKISSYVKGGSREASPPKAPLTQGRLELGGPPCGERPVKLRFQKAPLCKGGWLRVCGDWGIVYTSTLSQQALDKIID